MTGLPTSIYIACTDFLLAVSHIFGISYRDANALLFFIIWPIVTIALFAVVLVQAVSLMRVRVPGAGPKRVQVDDDS